MYILKTQNISHIDGGDEHGDEQSVGEDSGGGDDAESDEGSMNSAEAIEGDGNQLHDR